MPTENIPVSYTEKVTRPMAMLMAQYDELNKYAGDDEQFRKLLAEGHFHYRPAEIPPPPEIPKKTKEILTAKVAHEKAIKAKARIIREEIKRLTEVFEHLILTDAAKGNLFSRTSDFAQKPEPEIIAALQKEFEGRGFRLDWNGTFLTIRWEINAAEPTDSESAAPNLGAGGNANIEIKKLADLLESEIVPRGTL